MKILFIIKSFAMKAGVERLMSDKMNYMCSQGHHVTLVTYEQGTHPMPFPLHPDIRTVDLDTRFFTLMKYSLPRRMVETYRLKRLFRQRLQHIVDQEQPDIIHTTTYSINLIDDLLAIKTRACRTIESQVSYDSVLKENDFRGRGILQTVARLYDTSLHKKLRHFDAFFALTEGDAAQWRRFVPEVTIVPNPLTEYPENVREHTEEPLHRIVCAGRLNPQKGFDLLIQSFALIADKCPQWHVDIFGSGDQEAFLRQLIADHALTDRIIIHPATTQIYDEFQRSDFFVFSSRFEGWGLVLVEAMACGIPAVSFNCDYGPADIISHGQDGLLVENGDTEALGRAMLWMIEHPADMLHMGQAARSSARRFRKEQVVQQVLARFQSLLS